MSIFNAFKHLLPRAKAWRITIEKTLRSFFEGLANGLQDVRVFADLVWLDVFPQTTREILMWEKQFGILDNGSTDQERRDRLDNAWKLQKISTFEQIEAFLRASGFDVYLHQWWVPGTEPTVGIQSQAVPRDPTAWLGSGEAGVFGGVLCGELLAACGETFAACGNGTEPLGYALVNKITITQTEVLSLCGEPLAACNDSLSDCGEYDGFSEIAKKYSIPNDPNLWPYFLYIGAQTFGERANVSSIRRDEFENLCLKICPTQHWLGMLINYV